MITQAKKIVVVGVMALAAVVISLPVFSLAATAPSVTVLSPLVQGAVATTPVKIALDATGNIYVADQRVGGVVVFDSYGVQLTKISTAAAPSGLAIAKDGSLLVSQASFVVRYNVASGQEIGRFSGGQLQSPVGIAVDDVTGNAYVADSGANQIEMYSASGTWIKSFGKGVRADAAGKTVINPLGKLSMPTGISFEKISRQVAVADTLGSRVQFFDESGVYVKVLGVPVSTVDFAPAGQMQFFAPAAVVFEYTKAPAPFALNRVYVVDGYQNNLQVVNPVGTGTFLTYISGPGTSNGQLMHPTDAVFDSVNSRLLVVNGFGNVTLFGIDGGKNPVDITPPTFGIDPVTTTVTTPNVVVSGTLESGSSVTVKIGNPAVTIPSVVTATTWKSTVSGLVAGNNTITVTAADVFGNTAPAQSVNVTYLLPAPALTVSSAVPRLTNMSEIILSGSVDDGATVTVTNDSSSASGTAVVTGTSWSYKALLMEGANKFTVTAQKPLRVAAAAPISVVLDSAPPVLAVSALSDSSYTSTQVQNIAGTVMDTNAVSVLVNDIPAVLLPNGSFTATVSLLTGSNTIVVVACDLAGNVTVDTRNVNFDSSKPLVNIAAPMDNSFTNNPVLPISGTVNKVSTITVAGVPAFIDSSNNWSANINLVAGLNTVEIIATDLYGNTSTVKRTITLDAVRPVLAITTPTQDIAIKAGSQEILGTVNDDNSMIVTYSVNGITSPVLLAAGTFKFNVSFVNEGIYPIKITATDFAGNTTTATRSIIYDITPPALTLDAVKWQAHAHGGKISGTVERGATVTVREGGTAIGKVSIDGVKWSADLNGVSYNQSNLSVVATDAAGNSTTKILKAN